MCSRLPVSTRAKAARDFLFRMSDTFLISACPFALGPVPHPCVHVQWVQPVARNKAAGHFTLTEAGVAICVGADMAPQGTLMVSFTQPRVSGQ
jgi:hypothetical protein